MFTHEIILKYINAYGYAFIFFGTFLEGELVLLAGAFMARMGILNLWEVFIVSFIGAVVGDNFWFYVGEFGGHEILNKFGRLVGISHGRVEKGKDFLRKYGEKAVFFARFVFGFRLTTAVAAGSLSMPHGKFLRANALGAIVWVGAVGSLGFLLGKSFELLAKLVKRTEIVLLILAVLAIIILLLYFKFKSRKSNGETK